MRFFIDTEFTNFIKPQLISIGLVSEDGKHEFYAEIEDYNKTASSDFVKHRIEPLLTPSLGKPAIKAAADVWCWLEELGGAPGEHEIIADYPTDYDLLLDLLGDEIPANFNRLYVDLFAQLHGNTFIKIAQQGRPDHGAFWSLVRKAFHDGFLSYFEKQPHLQHHALHDARANRLGWIKANEKLEEHY